MTRRFIRVLAALCVVAFSATFGVLDGSSASAQTSKTFRLSKLETTASVNADGSMDVNEAITYFFSGGTFSHGNRSFQPKWRDRIVGFAVTENNVPLSIVPPPSSLTGEWQWDFASTDGEHTYNITYHVPDAVQIGSDVGRLNWQFIGKDHPGVAAMHVAISLPGEFGVATPDTPASDTSVVRAWAHGPSNGTVQPNTSGVELSVNKVPARTFVEADVVIPVKAFSTPGSAVLLPTILKEEKSDLFTPGKSGRRVARLLAPLLSIIGLGAFGATWWTRGKEPATPAYIGDYWREPLDDPPAVVAATLGFGSVDGKAMASTLVDLAQRGFLTIAETGEAGLLHKRPVYTFTATTPKPHAGQTLPAPPSPYESELLANVFRGQHEVSSEDFRDWAQANQTEAAKFWTGWKAQVSNDMKGRGYIASSGCASALFPIGIAIALGLAAFQLIKMTKDASGQVSFWGLLCAAAAVIVLALTPLMRKRTVLGTEKSAKAEALKKYLEDFSNMDEAPVGSLILWERFLVYAVALGCASKVYQGLRVKLPDMVNNGGFAPWYVPMYGHDFGSSLDRFPTDWGGSAASAMTPQSNTSSGSGGGFSGGGGGGGGGGGFGAS